MENKVKNEPAIIIGGGPAGLTTAYEWHKLGKNSIILEADSQVGGISKTVNYQGNRFDIGGHRFFSKVPYVNQLWDEILSDDLLVCERLSRIHYQGNFFDYPLKPLNALKNLGILESTLVGLSYTQAKIFKHGSTEAKNFEEWVVHRFGYRLYEIFFKTYTEKVWGIPCQEISADWAAQRIKNLSLKEAVKNALLSSSNAKDKEIITSLIEQFKYPRLGPGMMWEHCQSFLEKNNNPTILKTRVTSIQHHNNEVLDISSIDNSGAKTNYNGDQYVSSMPLRELIFSLNPPPPNKVLEAAKKLRYRDYLTVVLIVNRKKIFPDNWIYIHTPEVKLGRIQNYKNWSKEMVKNPNHTTLGLEYFLWEKDEEWNWSDDRLIDLGIKECTQIGIIKANEVVGGTIVRMKKAYPVYDHAYAKNLDIIKKYMGTFSNLQTIGRNGLHRYNNQDHSMMTGVYAARNIFDFKYDVWAVNTEQEYHEEDKVQQQSTGDRLIPMPLKKDEQIPNPLDETIFDNFYTRLDPIALGVSIGIISGSFLFIITAVLLLKGGDMTGANLSLLSNYLIGFEINWIGAIIGFIEMSIIGFMFGFLIASLRNIGFNLFLQSIHKDITKSENKDLLDKI